MKHFILFHKDYTKFFIKCGLDATWLPHSAPIQLNCQGASEVGKSVEWNSIMYKAGYKLFHIYTISHIHRYTGSQRKEWAPVLFSCIKKHQCPGLDTHCC